MFVVLFLFARSNNKNMAGARTCEVEAIQVPLHAGCWPTQISGNRCKLLSCFLSPASSVCFDFWLCGRD